MFLACLYCILLAICLPHSHAFTPHNLLFKNKFQVVDTQKTAYFKLYAKNNNDAAPRKRRKAKGLPKDITKIEENLSTPIYQNIGMMSDTTTTSFGSKLPPLTGTIQDKQAKFSEKSAVQRYIDDLLAPTPIGEEPKSIILLKSITWFAVIVLVLIEIGVSVKVGGMPFDLGKISLPSIPNFFNDITAKSSATGQ